MKDREFDDLVHAALEGRLDGESKQRLATLLEDPRRREAYLRRAHLAAMLDEHLGESPATPARRGFPVRLPWLAAAAAVALAWIALDVPRQTAPEVAREKPELSPEVEPLGEGRVVAVAIDISASMLDDREAFGRVTVRVFEDLDALGTTDRFNLVAVGRELQPFRSAPVVATAANVEAAREWFAGILPEPGPPWQDRSWRTAHDGRHFGSDLLAAMELCFSFRPDRIVYATDWVMEPGSIRTEKQRLVEQTRRWQARLDEPARLDVIVAELTGHNRFLEDYAAEHGGTFEVVDG